MFLKQSTAYTFRHGPFLDDTDGKTAETGLTISQADVRLSKAGGDFAQKNESSASAHDEIGYYIVVLDTTDTNTCGELLIAVHESGALPVFKTFQVLEETIYDSLFAASAAAFDANQRVDVAKIEGSDATDQINAACDTAMSDYDAPTKAEMDSKFSTTDGKIDVVDGIVDNILVDTAEIGSAGAGLTAVGWNAAWDSEVQSEVTDALNAYDPPTKAELDSGLAGLNDISTAQVNTEVDTALADIHLDHLLAADYDPASKPGTATALFNELIESDGGVSRFTVNALEQGPSGSGGGGDATEAKQDQIIAAVITNAAGTDVSADIIAIKAETATIVADTNELQTDDVPGLISALNNISTADVNAQCDLSLSDYDAPTKAEMDSAFSTTDALISTVDTVVDSILVDTAVIGAAGAGLTDLGGMSTTMKAQVNTEADSAISDYDPPTKAELDSAHSTTDALITVVDTVVDANATKLDTLVADSPGRPAKGVALVASSDHVTGKTGATVTATRSLDGAAFAACANSATEVSGGIYKITLASTDLDADTVVLKFTATDADTRYVTIVTQST